MIRSGSDSGGATSFPCTSSTTQGGTSTPWLAITAPSMAAWSAESRTSPKPAAVLARPNRSSGISAREVSTGDGNGMAELKRKRAAVARSTSGVSPRSASLAKTTLALWPKAVDSGRQALSRRESSLSSLGASRWFPPW